MPTLSSYTVYRVWPPESGSPGQQRLDAGSIDNWGDIFFAAIALSPV